jgi:predicted nuclease with RNAse H fold
MRESSHIVVGVDVGGVKKGFHAVALHEGTFAGKRSSCDARVIVQWCRSMDASVVAVDAPCAWSLTGRRRSCERELAGIDIQAFATPSVAIGQRHPFYGWMLNGAKLFRLLGQRYQMYSGQHSLLQRPLCFETFPHAIACALAGRILSAKSKRVDRRRLLNQAGIATDVLRNMDELDAALCASAAHHFLSGTFKHYGDEDEGYIIVPRARLQLS